MTPRKPVAVCGTSLYMAGIAVSLQAHPALDVMRISRDLPGPAEYEGERAPAVIVFDLVATPAGLAIALLHERPELVLIGIDPSSDQMRLWSGRRSRAMSMQDLLQAIGVGNGVPASNGAAAAPLSIAGHLAQSLSRWTARIYTRRQKTAFALAAVALAACLAVLLAPQLCAKRPRG